jgi:hypothetical protein
LPGTVWIQLPSATPSRRSGPKWIVVAPSALASAAGVGKRWLPARGNRCSVWSIERVWLSYSVSDQKRAAGMSGGSVTVYASAPSKKSPSASLNPTRYCEPMFTRRMHMAGVIPVYP